MKSLALLFMGVLFSLSCYTTTPPYAALYTVPTAHKLTWPTLDYYNFVHFNMNTFTNMEWASGGEKPEIFNPTSLDCLQQVNFTIQPARYVKFRALSDANGENRAGFAELDIITNYVF